MEGLPNVIENVRLPVRIPSHPYLLDHCVEGRSVLPAVEAMELLAASVRTVKPDAPVECMADGWFDKFLYIPRNQSCMDAISDIALHADGDVTARLVTKTVSPKTSMTRVKTHAQIRFSRKSSDIRIIPYDLASSLEGIVTRIPSEKIYKDLVPFGRSYQNIKGDLRLSPDGVIAEIGGPAEGIARDLPRLLGYPFPLDAAFHAACVWGQRFVSFVPFPVGFEKRMILAALLPGESYVGRVIPVRTEPDRLVFDVWIFSHEGSICEAILGIVMRDISAGRMRPPPWIRAAEDEKTFGDVADPAHILSLIEIDHVAPFAEKALSDFERKRFQTMGVKRKKHYLAARLACKRLARRLSGNDVETPAEAINTVDLDMVRPRCPVTNGGDRFSCAASHDSRFAVAVASDKRIGVDVESVSEKVLMGQKFFVNEREKALAAGCALDEMESILRIWSIKEAACKALNIRLTDAWKRVEVIDIGRDKSGVIIDGTIPAMAYHDTIDRHLLTIIEIS